MVIRVFVILIMMLSVIFFVFAQLRLRVYLGKNPLPESKYTKLFGFIGIRSINAFYAFSVLAHAALFIWLTFYYI